VSVGWSFSAKDPVVAGFTVVVFLADGGGDEDDWVWRTEQVVGKEGWNKEPWANRFPGFRRIMNQEKMRHYPIECVYAGNRFSGNWRNIEHRIGSGPTGVKPVEEVPFI